MNKLARSAFGVGALTALLTAGLAGAQPAFRAVKLPNENERVTGIYCAAANACVISTDMPGGPGHVYASDGKQITATLITGDSKFAEPLGTLGDLGFLGFTKVGDRLVVHTSSAGGAFISATGDITKPASWSAAKIGVLDGGGTFGLNQQMGIGTRDGRWVLFTLRTLYDSTDAPGPGALWSPLWSPVSPSVPRNFAELQRADKRLCDSDPGTSIQPRLTQPAYVAPDLSLILYPNGARNQRGSGNPGVCISTDGGRRFYRAEFKGVEGDLGPLGVTCAGATRCLAYGGLDYAPASAYIFVSNDPQKGPDSSWTRATLPALRENAQFRHVFFAPGGTNGWAVGKTDSSSPLLLQTSDGGATWRDATASVRALAPSSRLHAGFAFDAEHVWIGGERGLLLTSGN
ncbi:hypothetical protein [Calidithermus chliarophilus]|uniref:hypothetical protein n=1 Tax=Calidithermus chliarophilus TaxID=52023 RepID=UPI0004078917|nr:hypothetical protein [Calidithermus chliarophilus]